jgi:hypothetical protein
VQPFSGPWRVVARLGETTYTLEPLFGKSKHPTTVHISRMKPCPPNSSARVELTANKTAPFEVPASNGIIRIPSGRVRTGLGAVTAEDALHLSSNPREVVSAERRVHFEDEPQDMELDQEESKGHSPVSPPQGGEPLSPGHVFSPISPARSTPSDGEEKEQQEVTLRPFATHQSATYQAPRQTTTFVAPTLTGPAAAAVERRRTGFRPSYDESAPMPQEIEPRSSSRYSLPPRTGLAADALPDKRKNKRKIHH